MAHAITEKENGTYEFAFTGPRSKIWHGLGQELTQDASIEEWKKQAGMDWEIFQSKAMYQTLDGIKMFDDKNVLFRSDTKAPISVMSGSYKIVQPGEVLEFFRDLVDQNGFKLSAAGTLFGGKRYWATAEVGKTFDAVQGDDVNGQLLLVSSADGTIATIAKFVSTRTVCNNTLTVALGESGNRMVKKTHRAVFDPRAVKLDLGLIDTAWETFSANIKKLAEVEVSKDVANTYFKSKFYDPKKLAEDQTWGAVKTVNTLMGLFENGTGAEYSKGTAWGVVNSVTEAFTHGMRAKQDASRKFWEGSFGAGDKIKSEVYADMLEMMA